MRLRTLGGLWIEGDSATTPLGPRRMALLALAAAAGKKGITRDRIIGILWPDSDEEQARHTLSQNLYSLRRDTGRDWISATPELRLDPSITSDIGEFQEALVAGDLEKVADLYTGAFLDGFYLPGASEFERWVESERARLHAVAVRAHERLAMRADENGAHADSVRHWRGLTALDPLSGRYALGLMRALVSAGDRPGALAHARAHEQLVRRELESDPDPSMRELVAVLRSPAPPARPPSPRPEPGAIPDTPQLEVSGPESQSIPTAAASAVGLNWWQRRTTRWAAGIAVIVLPVTVATVLRPFGGRADSAAPFLAVGSIQVPASGGEALDPVLRDMLATKLGSIQGLQVVANSRLVELMHAAADTSASATTDAARRAGATEVIEGEVVAAGPSVSMTLRRVSLKNGLVRRGYVVRAADRFALVDSAATVIARDLNLTPVGATVTELRTASPVAYALYTEGLRAYYAGNAPVAYRLMHAALEHDSLFAMAAYYAWQASRPLSNAASDSALQRAKRLAPRAVDRERLLIQSAIAGIDAPVTVAVAIAETLAVRYPADPDGFIALGQARYMAGNWPASIEAFERGFSLDSAAGALAGVHCRVCEAMVLMTNSYLWWDSAVAAERTARRLIRILPNHSSGWGDLVEPLLRQNRRAEAEVALESVFKLNPSGGSFRGIMNRDLIRSGRFDELERELFADFASPSERTAGQWLLVFSLRNQGRLREAKDLIEHGQLPGLSKRLEDIPRDVTGLAIIALEQGHPREAAAIFRKIAEDNRTADLPAGFKARIMSWHLTLTATALAEAGDTAEVRRLAIEVEQFGMGSIFGRDAKLHHFLRGLIYQQAGQHDEAVLAFQRSLFSLTDGYTRTNLYMSRSLLRSGRAAEAIAILRPALHGGVDGSNTYVTHTILHEAIAEAFTRAGMTDSAAVHYRAVERAWRQADPIFRERYERAKALSHLPN